MQTSTNTCRAAGPSTAAEIDGNGNAVCTTGDLQHDQKRILNAKRSGHAVDGFAHHCAMTDAFVADILEEALHYYLKWDVYRHKSA